MAYVFVVNADETSKVIFCSSYFLINFNCCNPHLSLLNTLFKVISADC